MVAIRRKKRGTVITRNPEKEKGVFNPPKAGKYKQGYFRPLNPHKYKGDVNQIIYRSGWELKFMSRLDLDDSIIEWSSEGVVIPYFLTGLEKTPRRYFMDFKVKKRMPDGTIRTILVEIKPAKETIPPIRGKKKEKTFLREQLTFAMNTKKWEAARRMCEKYDWHFMIMTEKELGISK